MVAIKPDARKQYRTKRVHDRKRERDRKKERAKRVDRARRGRRTPTCGWADAFTIALLVACAAWVCS